jgi:hypothetical protein
MVKSTSRAGRVPSNAPVAAGSELSHLLAVQGRFERNREEDSNLSKSPIRGASICLAAYYREVR